MKLLSVNPFSYKKGFRFAEMIDFDLLCDEPIFSDENNIYETPDDRLKKFINNDYDTGGEVDNPAREKLGRLLFFLEYSASEFESQHNFDIIKGGQGYKIKSNFEPKYNFDIIKETYKSEEISICKRFVFFINILNALEITYSFSDFHLGKLDKLSNEDKFKRKKLTNIQKYVIIALLLDYFLSEIEIKNKTLFNITFHCIVMRFIDKSEAEADFLNNSKKNGILVSRGSIFLSRANYRSPISSAELQNIYKKIKRLYRDRKPLEELYEIKATERFFESRNPPKRSNKIWTKSFFLENIMNYENQFEMAKALGVSRQRVSEMKKKLKINKFTLKNISEVKKKLKEIKKKIKNKCFSLT